MTALFRCPWLPPRLAPVAARSPYSLLLFGAHQQADAPSSKHQPRPSHTAALRAQLAQLRLSKTAAGPSVTMAACKGPKGGCPFARFPIIPLLLALGACVASGLW